MDLFSITSMIAPARVEPTTIAIATRYQNTSTLRMFRSAPTLVSHALFQNIQETAIHIGPSPAGVNDSQGGTSWPWQEWC
jgi:hypothetical protein